LSKCVVRYPQLLRSLPCGIQIHLQSIVLDRLLLVKHNREKRIK
jgi:hypothetical protein